MIFQIALYFSAAIGCIVLVIIAALVFFIWLIRRDLIRMTCRTICTHQCLHRDFIFDRMMELYEMEDAKDDILLEFLFEHAGVLQALEKRGKIRLIKNRYYYYQYLCDNNTSVA